MKKLMFALSSLSFLAAMVMYTVGNSSGHLSELADLFWLPLPLGVICFMIGVVKNKDVSS